ncbi:MAG: hypothetical protein H7X76_10285 [Prolixibacteraceae bacterium]|nr:hypothetical protein [Burkholderiales bacterium]
MHTLIGTAGNIADVTQAGAAQGECAGESRTSADFRFRDKPAFQNLRSGAEKVNCSALP